jgi:hypothetical protein
MVRINSGSWYHDQPQSDERPTSPLERTVQ